MMSIRIRSHDRILAGPWNLIHLYMYIFIYETHWIYTTAYLQNIIFIIRYDDFKFHMTWFIVTLYAKYKVTKITYNNSKQSITPKI